MTHVHQNTDVKDSDLYFKIDPISRAIKNESGKTVLMQHDHNSERFTFEIPRYVEGHDMSLCDAAQIHYLNVGQPSTNTKEGVYEVDDLEVSADNDEFVTFSWLISSNATTFAGALNFVIHFVCKTEGEVVYSWDSDIYTGVTVNSTIHNDEAVVLEYADVLEQWRERLFGINNTGLSDVQQAVKDGVKTLNDTGEAILQEMAEKGDATAAQSWAVGGTGTRQGENTNNSWYWALESAKEAVKAKEAADSIGDLDVTDNSNISDQGIGSKIRLQKFLDIIGVWLTTKVVTHLNFLDDLKKHLKNNGDTTEEGFALDARYGNTIKKSIERANTTVKVTLTAAGWSGSTAPFTQTVNVPEITSRDEPNLVNILRDGADLATQKAYTKAYGIIASGTGTTGDGTVTFKVYKKPATTIDVGLKCLRGDI